MRKDAKIGFAVGGVLLAVLSVYVIVVPQHKKTPGHEAVTLAVTPGGASTDTPAPDSAVSIPPAAAPQSTPAPKPAIADKAADVKSQITTNSDGVNWESILGGNTQSPAIKSSTPAPKDPSTPPASSPDSAIAYATPPVDMSMSAVAPVSPSPAATSTPASSSALLGAGAYSYTVKPGQTLSIIAAEVYGNSRFYVAIKRANPNIDSNRLKPGMKITLPDISDVKPDLARDNSKTQETTAVISTGKSYKVQSGDTLYRISKSLYGSGKQADAIYALNKDLIGPDKAKLKIGMILKLPTAPVNTATASAAVH